MIDPNCRTDETNSFLPERQRRSHCICHGSMVYIVILCAIRQDSIVDELKNPCTPRTYPANFLPRSMNVCQYNHSAFNDRKDYQKQINSSNPFIIFSFRVKPDPKDSHISTAQLLLLLFRLPSDVCLQMYLTKKTCTQCLVLYMMNTKNPYNNTSTTYVNCNLRSYCGLHTYEIDLMMVYLSCQMRFLLKYYVDLPL